MKIQKGTLPEQVSDLLIYSKSDPEILKFTDDKSRFASVKKFNGWSKKHIVYVLTNHKKDLLGIVWFGLKEGGIHFAIRIYPPLRGKGYATKFMADVFKAFQYSPEYKNMGEGPIWLDTRKDNTAAIALYKKTGWEELEQKDDRVLFKLNFNEKGIL